MMFLFFVFLTLIFDIEFTKVPAYRLTTTYHEEMKVETVIFVPAYRLTTTYHEEMKVETVIFVEEWIAESRDFNIWIGETVDLTFEYTEESYEKITQIEWFFNRTELIANSSLNQGFNVEPKYQGRVHQSGETGILLHNISTIDSGTYTFRAGRYNKTVQLNVIKKGIAEPIVIHPWIHFSIIANITKILSNSETVQLNVIKTGIAVPLVLRPWIHFPIIANEPLWYNSETVQLNVITVLKLHANVTSLKICYKFVYSLKDVYYEISKVSYTCVNRIARLFPDDGDITHALLIFNRIKLIALISLDTLIVEPKYQGRVYRSGKFGILLHNISTKDSGTYTLYPLVKWEEKPNIQTVQLNVIENTVDPDCSCTKLSVIPKERSGQTYRIVAGTCTLEINSSFCCPVGLVYQYCVNDPSKLCVPIRNPNHVTESNTQYKTVNQEGDTNGDKEFITILICVLVIVIMVFCVIGVFKIHDWKNKNLKNNGETLDSRYAEESHSLNKQDKMSVITGIYEN